MKKIISKSKLIFYAVLGFVLSVNVVFAEWVEPSIVKIQDKELSFVDKYGSLFNCILPIILELIAIVMFIITTLLMIIYRSDENKKTKYRKILKYVKILGCIAFFWLAFFCKTRLFD